MFPGNLEQIPVTGNKGYLHAILLSPFCQGSQDIIRLKPRLLHGTDPHGGEHLLHHRNLLPQLLRHGFSRSLIFRVQFVSEGGRMHIEGHCQITRHLFLQYFKHDIQKTVDRIGMKSLGVTQIRHTIERPVQYAVPVNQYKLFAHRFLLPQKRP